MIAIVLCMTALQDPPVDISGEWFLGGTIVEIEQEGDRITARFASIGPNPYGVAPGDVAFTGTLAGRTVAGRVTVRAKTEHAPGLRTERGIELTLDDREAWLRGRYEIEEYRVDEPRWLGRTRSQYVALRREPCHGERKRLEELRERAREIAAEIEEIEGEVRRKEAERARLAGQREGLRREAAGISEVVERDGVRIEDMPLRREESRALWEQWRRDRAGIVAREREAWRRYRAGEVSVGEYQRVLDETNGELHQLAVRLMAEWERLEGSEGLQEVRRRAAERREAEARRVDGENQRLQGEIDGAKARKEEALGRLEANQREIDEVERAYGECVDRNAREDCADWQRRFAEAAEAYERDWEAYTTAKQEYADRVHAWYSRMVEEIDAAERAGDRFLSQYGNVLDFNKLVTMTTDDIEAFMRHVDTVDQVMAFVSLASLGKRLALKAGNRLAAGKLDDLINAASRRFSEALPRTARALRALRAANSSVSNARRVLRMYRGGDPRRWDVTADALANTMRRLGAEGIEDLAAMPSGSAAEVAEYLVTRDRRILERIGRGRGGSYRGIDSDIDIQLSYRRPDFSRLRGEELTRALEQDRVIRNRIQETFRQEFERLSGGIPPSDLSVTAFANPGLTRAVPGNAVSRMEGVVDTLFNRPNPEAYVSRGSLWMQMMMDRTNARAYRLGEGGWNAIESGDDFYRGFFRHGDIPNAGDAYGGYLENAFKVEHYAAEAVRAGGDAMSASKRIAKYYMRAEYMRMMADPRIRRVIETEGEWAARLADTDPHDFVAAFAEMHPELMGAGNAARLALARRLKAGEKLFDDPEMARHFAEDTLRYLRNESPELGRVAEDALSAMDDAAHAGHIRATNEMMLAGHTPESMRALGLSDDAIRRAMRLAGELETGPPLYRRVLERIRAQAGEFESPIGSLPYDAVRSLGALPEMESLAPEEELPSIEWWLAGKVWQGISSPFRSIAELERWFFAGIASSIAGDALLQELRWLSEYLEEMNNHLGETAGLTNRFRNEPQYEIDPLREKFAALESRDRPEDRLLADLDEHIRVHGPDACLVRLRDRVREWMAQMAEIRQREKGVLDTMSETVANLRTSCDLIWQGAVDASAANREVIGRTYKPERILEPAVVVNVEKASEWLRGWREVIQELRGVGGGGEEGDEDE